MMKSLGALAVFALIATPAWAQLSGPAAGSAGTLTGSYQPDGTAVPFRWNGTRLQSP